MRTIALLLSLTSVHAATIYAVLGYGQSQEVGDQACPALSTTQPFSNLMLANSCTTPQTGAFVPLVENCVSSNSTNPPCTTGQKQESTSSGIGNTITSLAAGSPVVAVPRMGVGGTAIAALSHGTTPYNNVLTAMTTIVSNAAGGGNTAALLGISFSEGGSDYINNVTTGDAYEAAQIQLQKNFKTDLASIVGGSPSSVLFFDQIAMWEAADDQAHPCFQGDTTYWTTNTYLCGGYNNGTVGEYETGIPLSQWRTFRDNPHSTCLVGPQYQYTYYTDNLHMINSSSRALGEMHGKFIKQVALGATQCLPLSPRSITQSGTTVTVRLWVPVSPIVLDTTLVADRADAGFTCHGFSVIDASGFVSCSATVTAGDTVTITLGRSTTGIVNVTYALFAVRFTGSGAQNGNAPGGNIRDSDTTIGQSGTALYNWLVAFNEPVGFFWDPNAAPQGVISTINVNGAITMQ